MRSNGIFPAIECQSHPANFLGIGPSRVDGDARQIRLDRLAGRSACHRRRDEAERFDLLADSRPLGPGAATMNDPAGNSAASDLRTLRAALNGMSLRRISSVIRLSDPLWLTTYTSPVPVTLPLVSTSALRSCDGASRIALSSIVFTSILLASPIVQALSS